MEADMLKMTVIVAATALLAFGVGVWAGPTVRAIGAAPTTVSTISPSELHLRIEPEQLGSTQIDNYN
jgi:hypothetical protein